MTALSSPDSAELGACGVAHVVELHGRPISYRQVGSGPVVLLVHGLSATMGVWDDVVDALAGRCTVITLDLPGHGGSGAPAGDYSLGAYACVLRDLLDALGHRRATIVGHSLGGGVAMQFCYQFPERVDAVVLVASGGLGREISPWLRAATLPGAALALRVAASRPVHWFGDRLRRLTTPAAGSAPPAPRGADRARARHTFLRSLHAVADHRGQRAEAVDRLYLLDRVPVLLVWGRRDPVIPVVHAERAHAAMPNSRLLVFDDAADCPHTEQPARFAAALLELVGASSERRALQLAT